VNKNTDLKSENSLVSIVIMNYNGFDYILNCLDSVFKTKGYEFEVLLIDNNSNDNSHRICKEKFSQIRLFENKENLAMAARNIGIDNAKGKYVVFLDSDATVDPNWLQHLVLRYQNNGEGLYQGKILEQNKSNFIGSSGNFMNIFGLGFARGNGEKDVGQFEKFQQISFPVGACLFSSLETIKKIGYFDESNLLYLTYDDVDYGWKALSLGIHSFYEPKSIIYHPDGTSSKLNSYKIYLIERNRWICLLSYYTPKTILKLFPVFFLLEFGIFFFLLVKGNGVAKIKSLFSIIAMYNSIKNRRILLNKNKKLSDREMVESFVDTMNISGNLSPALYFNNIITKLNKIARNLI
jgi:GT2 family glycosyltransferase